MPALPSPTSRCRRSERVLTRACLLAWLAFAAWPGAAGPVYETLLAFDRLGQQPMAAPAEGSDGRLYGVTVAGGREDLGSVYRVEADGAIATIHSFAASEGYAPTAALVEDGSGSLWGACAQGGANGFGSVFRISKSGVFTKIVDFSGTGGSAAGSVPGGLILHGNGFLYGVTEAGGTNGHGTLFRLNPADGSFSTILQFTGSSGSAPGSRPQGPLAAVGSQLYGACNGGGDNDLGVLFSLNLDGSGYQKRVAFSGSTGSVLGASPASGLTLGSDGKLYGTTEYGGSSGFGVAFRFDPSNGAYSVLSQFADATGSQPAGPLAEIAPNVFIGTASNGGASGFGAIFTLTTGGVYAVLADLTGPAGAVEGASPRSGFLLASDGTAYGTASAGGPGQRGAILAVSPAHSVSVKARFTNANGWAPSGAPRIAAAGGWQLTMSSGGTRGAGSILAIASNGTVATQTPLDPDIGSLPLGGLIVDGNELLGVSTRDGLAGRGAAFRLGPNGTITQLASFSSTAGDYVQGPLLLASDGSRYGVAQEGGLSGNGTLFKIDANGAFSRVFSFSGATGTRLGRRPLAPLVQAANGTIFGVTRFGGTDDRGAVFRVASDGTYTLVHSFSANGPREPLGGLALGPDGAIYGSASQGGAQSSGALFRIDPSTTAIQFFADCPPATSAPAGPPAFGANGALYYTFAGGSAGYGGILAADSGGVSVAPLVAFTGFGGQSPGIATAQVNPGTLLAAGLAVESANSLLGCVPSGGQLGGGAVFRIHLATPYEEWKASYQIETNASVDSDGDGDGIPLLAEYGLELDPRAPDPYRGFSFPKTSLANSPSLRTTLLRDPAKTDLNVSVESSAIISGPWTEIARSLGSQAFTGTAEIAETPLDQTTFSTTVQLATSSAARFLRLRFTLSQPQNLTAPLL